MPKLMKEINLVAKSLIGDDVVEMTTIFSVPQTSDEVVGKLSLELQRMYVAVKRLSETPNIPARKVQAMEQSFWNEVRAEHNLWDGQEPDICSGWIVVTHSTLRETIPAVLVNEEGLYEGNLVHYFKVVFNHARNLDNPYHNLRHLLHMLWLCHSACKYYKDMLSKRQMRNLLIAALFHDFDHRGKAGDDDLNIELAIRGLRKYAAPEDEPHLEAICDIIRPTQYPYVITADRLTLAEQIMRDADVSQVFSTAWIQQVILGLAKERGILPIKVLEEQEPFLLKLEFTTKWAKEVFTEKVIRSKIAEARALLELLGNH